MEPFAGAAAYSMYWMRRRPHLEVVLYEIDPMVVGLWRRVLGMTPDELWDYPCPEVGERSTDTLWAVSSSDQTRLPVISNGGAFKVSPRMAERFPSERRRMADILAHIDPAKIEINLASYDTATDTESTWFVDPPYQKEGHRYASFNEIDFSALGEWCRSRRGQVIACESDGADWLDFMPHRQHLNQSGDPSTEVVWYSHPEPTLLDLM